MGFISIQETIEQDFGGGHPNFCSVPFIVPESWAGITLHSFPRKNSSPGHF